MVSQLYTKVIRALRQQQAAKYFREPVDWQKLKLWNYLEVVTRPMDLLTVVHNLEARKYETVEELRADVDLIWDNAIAYNGEGSWIKKYVDAMKQIASRKFAEIAARRRARAQAERRAARAVGYRGVGNTPVLLTAYFITPQMRLPLLERSITRRDEERIQLGELARSLCPAAVELSNEGRETKIDIDALEPRAFFRVDAHCRMLVCQQGGGGA